MSTRINAGTSYSRGLQDAQVIDREAMLRDVANELRHSGTWQTIERHFYGFSEAEALFRA